MNEAQIKEFRQKIIQQLAEARQQKLFWFKKEIALEGSLGTCDHILKNPNGGKIDEPPKEKLK